MKKTKQLIPSNNKLAKGYKTLVQELKGILDTGLYTAYKAVDNLKVQTYWQLGERIVREELKYKDRAEYGKFLVENLAGDLGMKRDELFRIVQFYRIYSIVATLSRQLNWSHYVELISINNEKKRNFYQNKTIQNSWSVRELRGQIKNKLYEKAKSAEIENTINTKLPAVERIENFQNLFSWTFVDSDVKNERELEDLLIKNMEKFLKSLGEEFAFLKRQAPVKIGDQTHHIDLVLYNRAIPCNILVDLKVGKITSEHIGQMNKYISYYKHNRQFEHEKDTIGLIIGREAGKEELAYALEDLEKKVFVATYKPKLPSDEEVKKAIKKLE